MGQPQRLWPDRTTVEEAVSESEVRYAWERVEQAIEEERLGARLDLQALHSKCQVLKERIVSALRELSELPQEGHEVEAVARLQELESSIEFLLEGRRENDSYLAGVSLGLRMRKFERCEVNRRNALGPNSQKAARDEWIRGRVGVLREAGSTEESAYRAVAGKELLTEMDRTRT